MSWRLTNTRSGSAVVRYDSVFLGRITAQHGVGWQAWGPQGEALGYGARRRDAAAVVWEAHTGIAPPIPEGNGRWRALP